MRKRTISTICWQKPWFCCHALMIQTKKKFYMNKYITRLLTFTLFRHGSPSDRWCCWPLFPVTFQLFCRKSKQQQKYNHHHQHVQVQHQCCGSNTDTVIAHAHGCDLSEKYWGEILERTLSSTSLHALQRAYSHPRMDRCNGLQEMKFLDTSVPDLWKKDKTTQTFDAGVWNHRWVTL